MLSHLTNGMGGLVDSACTPVPGSPPALTATGGGTAVSFMVVNPELLKKQTEIFFFFLIVFLVPCKS